MPEENENSLNAKKGIQDDRERIGDQMDDASSLFNQADASQISKDTDKDLSVVKENIDKINMVSTGEDISNTVLRENLANMYLIVQKLYNININLNKWLNDVSKQNEELIKERSKEKMQNDGVDTKDKTVLQRLIDLEKSMDEMEGFFNNSKPEELDKLIKQLEGYTQDPDVQAMNVFHKMFKHTTPEEIAKKFADMPKDSFKDSNKAEDNKNDDEEDDKNKDDIEDENGNEEYKSNKDGVDNSLTEDDEDDPDNQEDIKLGDESPFPK